MTAPPGPLIPFDGEMTPEEAERFRRDLNAARLGATPAERLGALIAMGEQILTDLDNAIIADMEAGEPQ